MGRSLCVVEGLSLAKVSALGLIWPAPARFSRPVQSAGSVGDAEGHPTALEDAAPLALGCSTPDPVVNAVLEGVFEARVRHGAGLADLSCTINADAIAREEHRRCVCPAVAVGHPGRDLACRGKVGYSFVHEGLCVSLLCGSAQSLVGTVTVGFLSGSDVPGTDLVPARHSQPPRKLHCNDSVIFGTNVPAGEADP